MKAFELASLLEDRFLAKESRDFVNAKAAAELRRLAEVNAELLEALEELMRECKMHTGWPSDLSTYTKATAAIAKAKEQQ